MGKLLSAIIVHAIACVHLDRLLLHWWCRRESAAWRGSTTVGVGVAVASGNAVGGVAVGLGVVVGVAVGVVVVGVGVAVGVGVGVGTPPAARISMPLTFGASKAPTVKETTICPLLFAFVVNCFTTALFAPPAWRCQS